MSKTRNPRLEIPEDVLRDLYLVKMWGYAEFRKNFRINDGNLRATLLHYGIPLRKRGPRTPKHHGSWQGGRRFDKSGYVLIHMPDHPDAAHQGCVREHRMVMAAHLGRDLKPGEVVHHKNGNKADNRIDNLELFASNADHLRHELTGRVPKWKPEGKQRILAATRKPRKKRPAPVPSTPPTTEQPGDAKSS